MNLDGVEIELERNRLQAHFPGLARRLDTILLVAQALYAKAGSPDGEGEQHAYRWCEQDYERWRRHRRPV